MPILAIAMGVVLAGFVCWQLSVGTVYFKSSVMTVGQGLPFLLAEVGLGVYIAIKGVRGLRSGCWPPPPLW